ncbi:MAG: hypothetical protein JOY80_02425 [Candidatus Dormibacteraeota bacterium]|nr:hypothetical protein [Candidatus Dormibacteraeota bacterium]
MEHFTHVDYQDRMAFVAELRDEIIAVGRYERLATSAEAEVAFVVTDRHQRRGSVAYCSSTSQPTRATWVSPA